MPTSSPTDRGARPLRLVAEGPCGRSTASSAGCPAGHKTTGSPSRRGVARRGRAPLDCPPATRGATLQIPSDGGVRSLASCLDRSTPEGDRRRELSLHTPDLDDVFLARPSRTTTPAPSPSPPQQRRQGGESISTRPLTYAVTRLGATRCLRRTGCQRYCAIPR